MEDRKLQQQIIDEFGSEETQKVYIQHAEEGLWKGEKQLIEKYFKHNASVLDLGCGTGRTTLVLSDMEYKVVGIDITPNMIDNAGEIAKAKGRDIVYEIGDATQLRFVDQTFDCALFSNQGWTQIPSEGKRTKALEEIYRVLKPGGYYIFTVHPRKWFGRYFFFWVWKWFKFYILKNLGVKVSEEDFGDRLFKRESRGHRYKMGQFIHIPSVDHVKKLITDARFKLLWSGKINKSPVFFVCQK